MFDQVKLKRNGWHQKVQMWTFGWKSEKDLPFKNNFCPYFWLTIFCCLVSPFTLVLKGLKSIFMSLFLVMKIIGKFIDKYICSPLFEYQITHLPEEDIYSLWKKHTNCYSGMSSKEWDKWSEYKKRNPNWERKVQSIKPVIEEKEKNRREKEWLKDAARRKKEAEFDKKISALKEKAAQIATKIPKKDTKKIFAGIIKYTKAITGIAMYTLAATLVSAVGYGAFQICLILASIDWTIDWEIMKTTLLVIGGVSLTIGIAILAVWLYNKCNITLCPKWLKRGIHNASEKFVEGIISISKGIEVTFRWIGAPFLFFVAFIKAYKEENCPAIVWEDE